MNKRVISWLSLLIIVAVLVLGSYYIYNFYFNQQLPIVNENPSLTNQTTEINPPLDGNGGASQNINSNLNGSGPVVSAEEKNSLQALAIIFGQNYGTYSNQTNLTNFDELYDFMGAAMKNWVSNTLKSEIIRLHPRASYYAMETKVLNVEVTAMDETAKTASVLLKTQRQEFIEAPDNVRVFNQDLLLNLVKINENWMVSSAYWQ